MWRVAASAQQLPPGAGMAAAPPCDPSTKPTPARVPNGFHPNFPTRSKLSDAAGKDTQLVLSGSVIGLRCGLIAGATVEVWHADARGVIDATHFRGSQLTDADGRYHVETIVPGAAPNEAPRVNLRVLVPKRASLSTVMFLPKDIAGAANAKDKAFDPLLAMTLVDRTASRVTASFNVILDL